jgi:hypothetical protein
MATASKFLAIAASQIGFREGYDREEREWNNDNKFGVWYGMNRVAWCGIFVSWVAWQAGVLGLLIPKYASCFAGLKWFRDRELTGNWPPKPGDIFIMRVYKPGVWNADPDGWATAHTGIVEKYLGNGRVQTIEGNTNTSGSPQGNGVYRLIRQDSADGKQFIYCRPKWDPEPVVVAPKPPVVVKPPAPKPAPSTKPIPGSVYTGSKRISVKDVRPGKRNPSVERFNGLLWAWLCKNSRVYAQRNVDLWMKESSDLYGKQAQRATQEMYRVLNARQPKVFDRVRLPTWPGKSGVKVVGGIPV